MAFHLLESYLASLANGSVLGIMDSELTKSLSNTHALTPDGGMTRVFSAALSLVKLMSGKSWDAVGLPDVYQVTARRLERLRTVSVTKIATL